MSCPTCDHTLATLCVKGPKQFRHCQRCGTVTVSLAGEDMPTVYVPKLVERCRSFEEQHGGGGFWRRLGISESINIPERRPT